MAVGDGSADGARAVSATHATLGEFDVDAPRRSGEWWDYLAGVASSLPDAVRLPRSIDIAVWSDVPEGAGLSSSAALEVAGAAAFCELAGERLEAIDLARASHRAETGFVGVASGIMDQFASALGAAGNALHLDCLTERYERVPFAEAILIFDTAVPRSLRGSAFNERRAECEEALRRLRELEPGLPALARATP